MDYIQILTSQTECTSRTYSLDSVRCSLGWLTDAYKILIANLPRANNVVASSYILGVIALLNINNQHFMHLFWESLFTYLYCF